MGRGERKKVFSFCALDRNSKQIRGPSRFMFAFRAGKCQLSAYDRRLAFNVFLSLSVSFLSGRFSRMLVTSDVGDSR